MINYIWGFFITIGITYSLYKGININSQILLSSSKTIDLILTLIPIMCLWLGIMNIAKESGLLNKLTHFITPILRKLFPELKKNSPALPLMATSIIMNLFGLGNAATPFGLKAMKSLKEENHNKNEASNSMITFLVITTSGLTLIPTTVIAIRSSAGSPNPTSIIIPCIIVSIISLTLGLILNRIIIKLSKGG